MESEKSARKLLLLAIIVFIIGLLLIFALFSSRNNLSGITAKAIDEGLSAETYIILPIILLLILFTLLLVNIFLYRIASKESDFLSRINMELINTKEMLQDNHSDEMKELVMSRNQLLAKLEDNERKIKKSFTTSGLLDAQSVPQSRVNGSAKHFDIRRKK